MTNENAKGWGLSTLVVIAGLLAGACGGGYPAEEEAGDGIMLSDNTRLTRGPLGWQAAATGVTANITQADPSVVAHFDRLPSGTLVFQNVEAWQSNQGPTSFDLSTSRQTAFAQWDGSSYAINGLVGGPAFADTDTLTVTGSGATVTTVTVEAPPPLADPSQLLGAPNAFATQVQIPDGTFDQLYVFALADDGSPGDDGFMRFVNAEDMALEGGMRTDRLLDADAIGELETRSMTITAIYIAYYNVEETTAFFDGRPVPIQAGRMFQISPSDLWP